MLATLGAIEYPKGKMLATLGAIEYPKGKMLAHWVLLLEHFHQQPQSSGMHFLVTYTMNRHLVPLNITLKLSFCSVCKLVCYISVRTKPG